MPTFRLTALLSVFLVLCLPLSAVCATRKSHHSGPLRPQPLPVISSHSPGDATAAARDFNLWLDAVEQSGQVSGLAAAVVKGDKVLVQRGVGYADAERSLPVTTDTVFRLASLSKAFASALAAINSVE